MAFGKVHLVLGVDPLPPPGSRREPPTGEKAEGDKTSEKTGEKGDEEVSEPEAKRARVADPKE